jgi:hypothetical protein
MFGLYLRCGIAAAMQKRMGAVQKIQVWRPFSVQSGLRLRTTAYLNAGGALSIFRAMKAVCAGSRNVDRRRLAMTTQERLTSSWQDSLNFLLGLALFVSPWVLSYTSEINASWNANIVGAVIAIMALAALFAYQTWEEWVSGLLGIWLIVAPWVLAFSAHGTATLTHVLIGIATLVLAIWSGSEHGSGRLSVGR